MISVEQVFYDIYKNKVVVQKVLNTDTFLAIVHTITKYTFNGETTEKTTLEQQYFDVKDIGIKLFYSVDDCESGRILAENKFYKWNAKSIIEYFNACDEKELKRIKENAPSDIVLSERDREKLIRSYSNKQLQDAEEDEFRSQYRGRYFGRMDFDVEYFSKKRPDLLKEHYYNKVYIGKHGSVTDKNNKLIIVDWRSPIGGFFSDNENRFFDPDVDKAWAVYNYELIMKRKFSDDCSRYATVFVADESMYKDGDMDPFLIEVLTRLRRSGNDKAVDIIETIQSEQNAIVRENLNTNFYVQGCAGSGKTMILLHRLSCLLYNNKYLDTSKIKIITPNEQIINQLRELSAELEISDIQQMTLERYYLYLISEYSKSLLDSMQIDDKEIHNESLLPQDFLEYVYSDACISLLDTHYNKFFDSLSDQTSKYISFENNYDHKSMQEYARKLFDLHSEINRATIEKINKGNQKSLVEKELDEITKQYNQEIKSNTNLQKLENKINELNEEKLLIQSLTDDLNALNKNRRLVAEINLDKEKGEGYLKEFYYVSDEMFEETVLFRSITEIVETENKNKESENTIITALNGLKDEKNKWTMDLNNALIEIEALKDSYSKISKFNLFKRLKISNKIKMMTSESEDIEYKISLLFKSIDRKEKELESLKNKFNNIRFNGKKFIENKLEDYEKTLRSLQSEIKLTEKKINSTLEKYNIQVESIESRLSEIQAELAETENQLLSENGNLLNLKNKMKELGVKINTITESIATVYPYLPQEVKEVTRQCNKILYKSENGEYDKRLKLTDYRFVFDVLEVFLEDIYSRFDISNKTTLYKHTLYFILHLLVRMYGQKSITTMLNIDEAQDITINEYELIRKANIDSILNLYGDTNQLLYKNRGVEKWENLAFLELKGFKLNINYRNIAQITNYCNKELYPLSMDPMGVEGESVGVIDVDNISSYLDKNIYVIVKNRQVLNTLKLKDCNFIEKKDDAIVSGMINVMTVEMTKGMEFSNVLVVDIDMSKREKYVAYTRALNKLIVAR